MVAAVAGSPCSPSDFGKGEKFMQVLFLVLNRTEYLETLLERLLESGIHGCTVLDSMGMMRVIDKSGDDLPMFGALRQLFDPARESSKTLMMVLAEDEVHKAKLVVRQVVGGLDWGPISNDDPVGAFHRNYGRSAGEPFH